jgi:hypothetical protein
VKGSKLGFLEKYGTDPVVASAILWAPGFLSGLTETEVTFVKQKVEQHVARRKQNPPNLPDGLRSKKRNGRVG